MKNINDNVFLSKITQRVKDGDFDTYLTLPFQSRELFIASVRDRILKKINTGGTPILSDMELKDCILDTKEAAVNIIAIYLKFGFMIKTETGFEFTEKGKKAFKEAYK